MFSAGGVLGFDLFGVCVLLALLVCFGWLSFWFGFGIWVYGWMKCCVDVFSVTWGFGFGMMVWWVLMFWLNFWLHFGLGFGVFEFVFGWLWRILSCAC